MNSNNLVKTELYRLKLDGWNDRVIRKLLLIQKRKPIFEILKEAHLIGSPTFQVMFKSQFKWRTSRDKLTFLMHLVTNSNHQMDFSSSAKYHFDPHLPPDSLFLKEISSLVVNSYPKTKFDLGPDYIGFNDQLGAQLQLFRQLIDQQNIRFVCQYSEKNNLDHFYGLLDYLKSKNTDPELRIESNYHSKYLRNLGFKRQKNFKVETLDRRSEFIFSLSLGHPLVSQWINGTKLLPDGSMDLTADYSDEAQEAILDGESFNYGNTRFLHRYLDVNQPKVDDVRTTIKNLHRWTSESDWYAAHAGSFADIVRHDSLVDLVAWDHYQIAVDENEDLLQRKYHDFVNYCRARGVNRGFDDYYRRYDQSHWFQG